MEILKRAYFFLLGIAVAMIVTSCSKSVEGSTGPTVCERQLTLCQMSLRILEESCSRKEPPTNAP